MTKTSQQQKKQAETQAAAGKDSVQFEALPGKNSDDGTRKKKKKKQTVSAAAVAKPAIEKKTKKKKKEKKVMQQAAENLQQTVKAVSGNDGDDAVSVPNTTVTAAAAVAAVVPKRKRRFKPGTVAKREIRKYQNGNTNDGTRLLLRKTPFRRLCKEVLANFVSDRRFTQEATHALQVATEAVAVEYMTKMAISARLTGHHTVGLRHSHHVRGIIMPDIGTPEIRDAATGQRTFGDATSYSSSAASTQVPQQQKHRRKSGTPKRVVVAAPSTVALSEPTQAVDETAVAAADDNNKDDSDATDSSSAAEDAPAEAVGTEAATAEPASTAD